MRIGKYELGFNSRRIWANLHDSRNTNVCIPINYIYKQPIEVIGNICNVFRGKHPF
jgi:hypothetical protein